MKLKNRLHFVSVPALIFACASGTSVLATEVYTWTDKDGVVHYSDMPSESAEVLEIDVQEVYKPGAVELAKPGSESPAGSEDSPLSAAQQRRERMAKNREERREAKAETEQMCARHRQRLEQMEPARRVFYTDESGESVRMDDDQRMELIKEDKDYIAKNCE